MKHETNDSAHNQHKKYFTNTNGNENWKERRDAKGRGKLMHPLVTSYTPAGPVGLQWSHFNDLLISRSRWIGLWKQYIWSTVYNISSKLSSLQSTKRALPQVFLVFLGW